MVWGAISSHALKHLVVLEEDDHRRPLSNLADHIYSMRQTLFPLEHPVFLTTPLFTRFTMFKHHYMRMMKKWNI
ncbi:hypothetical protein TNCV_1741141 [Trichonephila clavipes]|uniref:Uncharacterized protein n=1 Tax=Trichonephila clavipes TaxID=2585209 RepID=A0A8X6RGM0_TRICX|nr:hypothetical protein TNCV_1741141 [Trichonephila clavipes]